MAEVVKQLNFAFMKPVKYRLCFNSVWWQQQIYLLTRSFWCSCWCLEISGARWSNHITLFWTCDTNIAWAFAGLTYFTKLALAVREPAAAWTLATTIKAICCVRIILEHIWFCALIRTPAFKIIWKINCASWELRKWHKNG